MPPFYSKGASIQVKQFLKSHMHLNKQLKVTETFSMRRLVVIPLYEHPRQGLDPNIQIDCQASQ